MSDNHSFPMDSATSNESCLDSIGNKLKELSCKLNEREEELTTFSQRMAVQEKMIENQEKEQRDATCRDSVPPSNRCEIELKAQMTQVRALKRRMEDMSSTYTAELCKKRRQMEAMQTELRCLHTHIKKLQCNQRTEQDQKQLTKISALENDKRLLTLTLNATRSFYFDVITLEQSATCVPLTSGQITSFEGIVRLWYQYNNFTGDVWFPFQCPLTNAITTPVKDLGWNQLCCFQWVCELKAFLFRSHHRPAVSHWCCLRPRINAAFLFSISQPHWWPVGAIHSVRTTTNIQQTRADVPPPSKSGESSWSVLIITTISDQFCCFNQESGFKLTMKNSSHVLSCTKTNTLRVDRRIEFVFTLHVIQNDAALTLYEVELVGAEHTPFALECAFVKRSL